MAIFKRKVADFILRHSIAVTIIILVFFIASLFFVVHVKIDSSPEVFFNKEGKSYLSFQAWKEQFGSDDLIIIAFSDEDIFTEKNLALITDLSEKIEFLDYVDSVQSLTTVNNIIGYENDFIVDRLINDIPSDQATLSQLKIEAISNPLFKKNLVSSDGKTTALIIELEHVLGGEDEYKKEVMEHVIKILKQKNETKFYVSGSIATGYFISLYMQKDLNIFIPIMFAMIILILYVYFRKIRIIVFPLMTIGISLSFSLAVLNLLGYSINNLTTIIPPILMAIAIADSIHFMDESIQRKKKVIALNNVQTEDSFLSDTIAHIFFPCLLTTVTTAVGFFSLTTSNVPPVRALGVVVGLGVFFALLVTFTVLPALIKRFKVLNSEKDNKSGIKHEGEEFFDKYFASFLHAIGNFNEKYKVMIIAGTVVIIFLSFLGIKRIKVETSILEFFRKNSPLYSSTVFIEENLCGVHALNISLKTDKRDYFKNP
ncbi:MMPL family transporter, partial [Candidatus Pacearchaeota archaeon]|nr:MMPL family transporter [Candidatus Pacearchaeota archaeon]